MTKIRLFIPLLCVIQFFTLPAQTLVVDTFFYTGTTQTFVIPQCASNLTVMLHGAQGGYDTLNNGWPGGYGGRVYVVMTATPGAQLYVNVGGPGHPKSGGWNGGGNGGAGVLSVGGGGGGSSDIRVGSNSIANRIFVAAGGGGGGGNYPPGHCPPLGSPVGGGGGGFSCTNGFNVSFPGCPPILGCGGEDGNSPALTAGCSGGVVSGEGAPGGGGGMMSGGGVSTNTNGCSGTPGLLYQGGAGGDSLCSSNIYFKGIYGGGGGGGGYYGGGGGHSSSYSGTLNCTTGGAGGGGSTYLDSSFVITYSLWGGNFGTAGIYNPITGVSSGAVTFSYTINGQTGGPSLSITATPGFSVCSGQAISLSATGASSVSWSGGIQNTVPFTPTASGVYTVSAYGGSNCSSTATAAIFVLPSSSIAISPMFPAVCPGNSISLSVNGASSYNWSTGQSGSSIVVSPSLSTVYSVTGGIPGSNSSCSSGSTQVIVYPVPALTVSATKTILCLHESATIAAGGAITYTWTTAGGTSTINAGSMIVSPATNITYSVTGTAGNLCQNHGAISLQVNTCTGITDLDNFSASVFPNPTRGTFYVSAKEDARLIIYSLIGELIYSSSLSASETKEFFISKQGLYMLHYTSGTHSSNFKLLVID